MSKDINHLKAQFNAITELRAWIADEIVELEAPKVGKWEPEGGNWWVTCDGVVEYGTTETPVRFQGLERKTEQQADEAAKRMRTFNRMDAWIDENNDSTIVDCQVTVPEDGIK